MTLWWSEHEWPIIAHCCFNRLHIAVLARNFCLIYDYRSDIGSANCQSPINFINIIFLKYMTKKMYLKVKSEIKLTIEQSILHW